MTKFAVDVAAYNVHVYIVTHTLRERGSDIQLVTRRFASGRVANIVGSSIARGTNKDGSLVVFVHAYMHIKKGPTTSHDATT